MLEMPGGRPAGSRTGARKQTSAATAASAGRAKDKTIDLNGATLGSPNIDAPTTGPSPAPLRPPPPPTDSELTATECAALLDMYGDELLDVCFGPHSMVAKVIAK